MRTPRRPLKHLADVRVSSVDKKSNEGEVPVRLCNYTDVYYSDTIEDRDGFMGATASPAQIAQFTLVPGQTLLTKDSETAADIGVPAFVGENVNDLVCGYHLAMVLPLDCVDPRYLFWAITSTYCREQLASSALGVTRFGLRREALTNLLVPIRDQPWQRRRAAYLDSEVAHMDELIAVKQEMIGLLHERRRCVLDELIGEPRGAFAALRRFTTRITQGVSSQAATRPADGDEWGVLKLSAVKWGRFIPMENKALPPDYVPDPDLQPERGDLLVTRSNTPAYVGDACAVRERAPRVLLPDLIYRISLDGRLDADFASMALRTSRARAHLSGTARGTSQSMVKLRGEDVLATQVPVLPLADQQRLVQQFEKVEETIGELESSLDGQIELLRERRQSLITAVVTGEMEVA